MAVQGKSFFEQTLKANADLSSKQYHFMRYAGEGLTNQSSNSADNAFAGVLQNKPESGEFATVQRGGKQKVTAGGSISANTLITTNGSGRATAVSSGSNDLVIGITLEAASADGNVVSADIYQTPTRWGGLAI